MKYIDLKSIRRKYNISQSDLAKLLGKPQAYVSSVENHKKYATEDFIEKVAEVLGIDDMSPYITETPRKVIVRDNKGDLKEALPSIDVDNVQLDQDSDSKAMIASLIGIIESCHKIIEKKDEEIAHLRAALGEKYKELAGMLVKRKEEL